MATPTRRSSRATRAPERLTQSSATPSAATTPRKRAKKPAAAAASAFASPLSSRAKRQKTAARGQQSARRAVADDDDDEDDSNEEENDDDDEEQEDGEEEEIQNSSSSADEDDDSDFGQDEGPQSRPARARATKQTPRKAAAAATPKGKQRRAAKPRAQQTGGAAAVAASHAQPSLLLNAILDEQTAVAQVAVDWIASYRRPSSTDSATTELINFLIRLTGCPGQITAADLYEVEQIEAVLATLQAQAIAALKRGSSGDGGGEADGGDDLLMGRTKELRRFRKNALQFVQRLVVDGQHHVVFADVSEESGLSAFVEIVLQWLVSMAASHYRPFRHVATLAALAMQSALVAVRARIAGELQTAHRQLDSTGATGRRAPAAASRLRDRVASLTQQDDVAAAAFKALYDTVFIYRYRDIHAAIRAECLVPLAAWCRGYPPAYLNTEHLRYLGWALNDRDARVREAALAAALGPLLLGKPPQLTAGAVGSGVGAPAAGALDAASDEAVAEGFRPFVARFLPRLAQMAAGDVDARVQVAALRLVAQLALLGYVDPAAGVDRAATAAARAAGRGAARRKHGGRRAAKRSTYGHSLSQQLLEESSSDDEAEASDADAEADDGAAAEAADASEQRQPLFGDDGADDDETLACPRHATMRLLAPLVAHTHATVRGAAAELVAGWLRSDWVAAACADAGLATAPKEDSAEHAQLLLKAVGAFLHHLARMGQPADAGGDDGAGADEQRALWVGEQAAACIEEAWAAPATAVGLGSGSGSDEQQQVQAAMLAGAAVGDQAPSALDRQVAAATQARLAAVDGRAAAAAAALWPRLGELADLEAVAAFLGRDHSAQPSAACALAAGEETALTQAFAVWVGEAQRAQRTRRARGRAARTADDDESQRLGRMWQASFAPLLARSIDSPARLLPLAHLAAEALDVQQLFDASATHVLADVAGALARALERHGGDVRLARVCVAALDRLDRCGVLPGHAADEGAGDTAPGPLVRRAAEAAASLLAAAVASAPEPRGAHASAHADVYACVVPLRAMARTCDVSDALFAGDAAAFDLLLLLLGEGEGARAVPEAVGAAALDTAYYAVLWRALRVDRQLGGAPDPAESAAEAARRLRVARDRLVAACERLLAPEDSQAAHGGRLRELAWATLGRLLRLFTGPLAHAPSSADLRRTLDVPARDAQRVRAQLAAFFARRMDAWGALLDAITRPEASGDDDGDDAFGLYLQAPSSWSIAYARACAMAAVWAQWLGDRTVAAAGLALVAGRTGVAGLEAGEKARHQPQRAARRKVGFVALSAFDHLVQAAVDALRPQLAHAATRDSALAAYMAALRASHERNAAQPAGTARALADGVNVATLARFVGSAVRSAFGEPADMARHAAALAPAVVGAAWGAQHELAIAYGLAAETPDAAAWFGALAQTVAGVLRPRHADVLSRALARGLEEGSAEQALAAAVYQRALEKETAKLGAVQARMAEIGTPTAAMHSMVLASSPPQSPTPAGRTARRTLGASDDEMDVDA
ncbi:cohesin complex subunit [Coemansia interrupta]|uniref:Cohesin complex subunit n=1 Tax=Coemansia interrupta TaxID=1126814 RepID=A0A9W8HH73_9FUNG|nr:cohesin complex subunit [Coemansia interrupta]